MLLDLEEGRYSFDLIFFGYLYGRYQWNGNREKIRQSGFPVPIVFLTASADFALEGYEVQASGSLLKPLTQQKLKEVLRRLFSQKEERRICIVCDRRRQYLDPDEIVFAESQNHRRFIYLANGDVLSGAEKLNHLEKMPNPSFLRCHQSYLVNRNYIADVTEGFILRDGTVILFGYGRIKRSQTHITAIL